MMGQQPQTESLFYLSLPKTQLADHYTMPVASRVKCRAAGVLHRKLDLLRMANGHTACSAFSR